MVGVPGRKYIDGGGGWDIYSASSYSAASVKGGRKEQPLQDGTNTPQISSWVSAGKMVPTPQTPNVPPGTSPEWRTET